MENSEMPRRYVVAWRDVVEEEKGTNREREDILTVFSCSFVPPAASAATSRVLKELRNRVLVLMFAPRYEDHVDAMIAPLT